MVDVKWDIEFQRAISKIKDSNLKNKIQKQVQKIIQNPTIGKPMKYGRKGTRELYIKPFRLSYMHANDILTFLVIYHKDEQ